MLYYSSIFSNSSCVDIFLACTKIIFFYLIVGIKDRNVIWHEFESFANIFRRSRSYMISLVWFVICVLLHSSGFIDYQCTVNGYKEGFLAKKKKKSPLFQWIKWYYSKNLCRFIHWKWKLKNQFLQLENEIMMKDKW